MTVQHTKNQSPAFDYGRFLTDRFHTVGGVLSFLNSYKAAAPSEWTVQKWFQRGAVPAEWFAVLLAYLEIDEGQPISLVQYLRSGK